jgi:thiamine-monophosphate kinase
LCFVTRESDLIAALRRFATDPAARGLLDDAAVVELGGERLVFTHDMLVEGVHFLSTDPPEDVAWKLLAVNLSDLAAKGARPLAVLMGYSLAGASLWDDRFVEGLGKALRAFDIALLGGDTVRAPPDTPRSFGITAIGAADTVVPSRSGASIGDALWLTGTIGVAGAGLAMARGSHGPAALLERYRAPMPRLEAGQRLARLVSAMMDVSDGLLLDADRLAGASGVAMLIELDRLPLSQAYLDFIGENRQARLNAATAGDDYELLFTAPPDRAIEILSLSDAIGLPISRIGAVRAGSGLRLTDAGEDVGLPVELGYEHGG